MGEWLVPFKPVTLQGRMGGWEPKDVLVLSGTLQSLGEVPQTSRRLPKDCYPVQPLGLLPRLACIPLSASWISKNFLQSGGSRNNSSLVLKSLRISLASVSTIAMVCMPHRYGLISILELSFHIKLLKRVLVKATSLTLLRPEREFQLLVRLHVSEGIINISKTEII